jgi:hypothetical protein
MCWLRHIYVIENPNMDMLVMSHKCNREPSCGVTDLCKIQRLYHTKISRYQYKQDDKIINQAYQRASTVDCHQDLTKC